MSMMTQEGIYEDCGAGEAEGAGSENDGESTYIRWRRGEEHFQNCAIGYPK